MSLQVALGVAATMALMVGLVVAKLVQVRRAEVVTGQEELIRRVRIVRQGSIPSASSSSTVSSGEAKTAGEPIASGRQVRVEGLDDALALTVAPA